MKELAVPPDGAGMVFHTDARLRPDGEKGLLVNTLAGLRGILPAAGAVLGNPGAHPARDPWPAI